MIEIERSSEQCLFIPREQERMQQGVAVGAQRAVRYRGDTKRLLEYRQRHTSTTSAATTTCHLAVVVFVVAVQSIEAAVRRAAEQERNRARSRSIEERLREAPYSGRFQSSSLHKGRSSATPLLFRSFRFSSSRAHHINTATTQTPYQTPNLLGHYRVVFD